MSFPIMRVRDADGNIIDIPAIVGPPGPPGPPGEPGKNSAGVNMAFVQMMPGWMRGDIDGDGEITALDLAEARNMVEYQDTEDEQMLWCADADGDGEVTSDDADAIESYITGNGGITAMADYYNNWTYDEEEECFYIELGVTGVTADSNVVTVVKGTHKRGAFVKAECLDGGVRVYAKYLPNDYFDCLVLYMEGDGTALVIPENTAESTAPLTKLRMASSTPGSSKIFTVEVDDDGYMLIYEE